MLKIPGVTIWLHLISGQLNDYYNNIQFFYKNSWFVQYLPRTGLFLMINRCLIGGREGDGKGT